VVPGILLPQFIAKSPSWLSNLRAEHGLETGRLLRLENRAPQLAAAATLVPENRHGGRVPGGIRGRMEIPAVIRGPQQS